MGRSIDRRRFLALAAGSATGLLGAGWRPSGAATAPQPLSLLILGGTRFLGPAVVEAAQARGHKLTLFNRGKTNPGLFPEIEKLRGDRDPDKDEGLRALEGRSWDVVIDDSGYYPRMVRASAQRLAAHIGQYIFVSSISAYRDTKTVGVAESYPVATMADPKLESMGTNYENYGALKALCEQETRTALGPRATIVRPGYIVGPGDHTDRFTYWPVRAARGGEMLAPGAASDPVQIIDVRDLGEWLVLLAERKVFGTFNACGPAKTLTIGEMLAACVALAEKKPRLTWIPTRFLSERGEAGEGSIPIWAPSEGDTRGVHTVSNARAIKAGLRFRPLLETTRDTRLWFETLPPERRTKLAAGLSEAQESALLAAWHDANAAGSKKTG